MRPAVVTLLKFYGFLSVAAWLFLSSAIGTKAEDAASDTFPILFDARERIAKPDLSGIQRLRFLTTVDFPPFNFIDQTGKLSGLHVDLIREICKELDIAARCQVQAVTFPELSDALENGNGEAVIAGMAVTTDLRRRFAFSRPFMRLPARFAVGRKAELSGDTAAALKGRSVGVVSGTVHEEMLKAYFPDVKPAPFADRGAMLSAFKDGKVEAVFADGMQLAFWTAGADSSACCRLFAGPYFSERYLGEGLTIMARKDDEATIVAAIDHALLALSRNGRLAEIYLRYFPNGLF
ncbi:transporter substrate-binding domain-containing protein [Sinorhizobium sp. BG8]|uniref:transporter substrate-binding domain-containing protein n=1 Tax=Sinorhizobium sp. BG8 TaxID=2613773 RepID=UPI00193C8F9C|nr:transporter substrate-binding domain-containing protein [Sinorhizobium sp. BG8]QRM54109.1 transporter substrate-binding domain-containing protein [Sinorhizobium sp. BG8]